MYRRSPADPRDHADIWLKHSGEEFHKAGEVCSCFEYGVLSAPAHPHDLEGNTRQSIAGPTDPIAAHGLGNQVHRGRFAETTDNRDSPGPTNADRQ